MGGALGVLPTHLHHLPPSLHQPPLRQHQRCLLLPALLGANHHHHHHHPPHPSIHLNSILQGAHPRDASAGEVIQVLPSADAAVEAGAKEEAEKRGGRQERPVTVRKVLCRTTLFSGVAVHPC